MRKIISLIATLALLLTSGLSALAAVPFSDVDLSTRYYGSIEWMSEQGIVEGYSDGTFRPDSCVTRAEFSKMVIWMSDYRTTSEVSQEFNDIPSPDIWYMPYVNALVAAGAIQGYPDGSFQPGNCVNRAEAIKMAMLTLMGEVPTYRDYYGALLDVETNQWFYSYIDAALSGNMVGRFHMDDTDGFSGYKFFPGDDMTRKEIAEMLFRMRAIVDNDLQVFDARYEPAPRDVRGTEFIFHQDKVSPFGPEFAYTYSFWYPDNLHIVDVDNSSGPQGNAYSVELMPNVSETGGVHFILQGGDLLPFLDSINTNDHIAGPRFNLANGRIVSSKYYSTSANDFEVLHVDTGWGHHLFFLREFNDAPINEDEFYDEFRTVVETFRAPNIR